MIHACLLDAGETGSKQLKNMSGLWYVAESKKERKGKEKKFEEISTPAYFIGHVLKKENIVYKTLVISSQKKGLYSISYAQNPHFPLTQVQSCQRIYA